MVISSSLISLSLVISTSGHRRTNSDSDAPLWGFEVRRNIALIFMAVECGWGRHRVALAVPRECSGVKARIVRTRLGDDLADAVNQGKHMQCSVRNRDARQTPRDGPIVRRLDDVPFEGEHDFVEVSLRRASGRRDVIRSPRVNCPAESCKFWEFVIKR
jgi:hypothetical protein